MINSSIGNFTGLRDRTSTDFIVVHHSATKPAMKTDIFEIHKWHIGRGWDGVGYHFVIESDGVLRVGRPLNTQGAHVSGMNSRTLGICVVGGLDSGDKAVDNFSDAQYKTLQALLITLSTLYPAAKIVRHKDLAPTNCNEVDLNKVEARIV